MEDRGIRKSEASSSEGLTRRNSLDSVARMEDGD